MKTYEVLNSTIHTTFKSDDEINWKSISFSSRMPEWLIHQYREKVDWDNICYAQKMSTEFLEAHLQYLNFNLLSFNKYLTEDFIEKYVDRLIMDGVLRNHKLSLDFLLCHFPQLDIHTVIATQSLPEWVIRQHIDEASIKEIVKSQSVSIDFLDEFVAPLHEKELNSIILKTQDIPELYIESHFNEFSPYDIVTYCPLSVEMIERHLAQLPLHQVLVTQLLDCDFLERHANEFIFSDWATISRTQILTEAFMDKYFSKLMLDNIVAYQKLSEEFIESHFCNSSDEYLQQILAIKIPIYQKLSEKFIEKHFEKLSLHEVISFQQLSQKFVEKHLDSFNIWNVLKYVKCSKEFVQKYQNRIDDMDYVRQYQKIDDHPIQFNFLYLTGEEKKKLVQESGLFECYETYFIAYKAIRKDGYPIYNFQFHYEVGQTYTAKCDCTPNESSFGLYAGTFKSAWYLARQRQARIVKCKIKYEDVGGLFEDEEKLRCSTLEIIDEVKKIPKKL